jgi:hypothetical protein
MLLENVHCPNCGSLLPFRAEDTPVRCAYCGGEFRFRREARDHLAGAGMTASMNLLAREAAARWLEERRAVLQAAKSAAEARHQREMWRLEHEGAVLSFWPLLFVSALMVGMIFILTGGVGTVAGATFIVAGVVLSVRGWMAQNRLADSEEGSARLFGEMMAQFDRREARLRLDRERIGSQIERLIGAM